MNKERKGRLGELICMLDDILCELQDIKNEEEEAFDSLSESLQYSSRGDKMQEYIELMEQLECQIEGTQRFINDEILNKK